MENGAQYRPHDAERADAVKQARGGQPLCQPRCVVSGGIALYLSRYVEFESDYRTERDAHDEEHGILALREVLHRHVGAQRKRNDAHSVEEGRLDGAVDASAHDASCRASYHDADGIDNSS